MARGVRSQSGHRLPVLQNYMDDVTTLLQTSACTDRILKRLDELLSWARMRIKPSKSRSLSIRKGAWNDNISFKVYSEKIPLLVHQPVRSLGRLFSADLSDKHIAVSVGSQLVDGLSRIDQSPLNWSYQFTLYRHLMWPLKLRDISLSTTQKLDLKANLYIRKRFGLPRCLSTSMLFGRTTLSSPWNR